MKGKMIFTSAALALSLGLCGCFYPAPIQEAVLSGADTQNGENNSGIKKAYGSFYDYLKKIYKNADEYIDGYPIYITESKTRQGTYNKTLLMYKEYAVLDYDGDGEDELLICCDRSSAEFENRNDFDKEKALENTVNMFMLCENSCSEVEDGYNRVILGTRGGLGGGEAIFFSNGCVVTTANDELKSHGIKYDKVGIFNDELCEKMGIGSSPGSCYIGYSYFDMYERIEYDFYTYGSTDASSFAVPLYDDAYEKHLNAVESGSIVQISDEQISAFTAEGIGISADELKEAQKPEDEIFIKYLADIYKGAEIINGCPVEIEIDDTYQWGSWTTYKYFACADFDGDGTDELLTFKYGPYNGGMANMNENDSFTDSVYPYFDMYEISESGEVKNRDEEPYKIHGDLWLMGGVPYIDRTGFEFFDNAVFRYSGKNTNLEDSESYYIFDDNIYTELEKLGHRMYLDYEGMEPWVLGSNSIGSAICYTKEQDGGIRRKVGSHQDASFDLITEEEYKDEVNVLTGGNRLDTVFRDVTAERLGVDERADTFEENVYRESELGLADITLSGTVLLDNTTVDAYGNPEPTAVLKLDRSFAYFVADNEVVRVDEVQLGTDVSVRDTLNLSLLIGKSVNVTGSTFAATKAYHHRSLVMLVKFVSQL